MRLNILIVDDAQLSRDSLQAYLTECGHHAEAHDNPFTALESLESGRWDLAVTDLRMPSMDGLQLLKQIRESSPDTAVILMTAYATVETAVQALKMGAEDYLVKPFHLEQLRVRVDHLADRLGSRREIDALRHNLGPDTSFYGLVGQSPRMQEIAQQVELFAGRSANILITGETGTGKEMVAQALHAASNRQKGPFVPVPCGAIPRELAESKLFGHEAGAFTGAGKRRLGQLEMADGGTLFLDDVDDMPLELQPKLLRAIQENEFQRVGGERVLKCDVRVISSSKRDLEEMTREGSFREDLLYRLRVLMIDLPPLRERAGDILLLADHFLEICGRSEGERRKKLSKESEQKLLAHNWPGNVRELRHVIEYALAVAKDPLIQPDDLPMRVGSAEPRPLFTFNPGHRDEVDLRALQGDIEKEAILWALKKAQGDQSKAAEILRMPRTTFLYRLRQLKTVPPAEEDSSHSSTGS
jgi:DNA-binding NtrC family response regulator